MVDLGEATEDEHRVAESIEHSVMDDDTRFTLAQIVGLELLGDCEVLPASVAVNVMPADKDVAMTIENSDELESTAPLVHPPVTAAQQEDKESSEGMPRSASKRKRSGVEEDESLGPRTSLFGSFKRLFRKPA